VPLMVGRRLIAMSLLHTGDIAAGRAHFDCAIALYDRVEHRALATRFGQDVRVAILLTDRAGILPMGLCFSTSALGAMGETATFTISIFLSSLHKKRWEEPAKSDPVAYEKAVQVDSHPQSDG
jgi:hypothetical protein